VVNALFGYLAFLLFIHLLKADWLALALAYVVGITFNYLVFSRFVFHDRIGSVARYLASYIIAFALNFVLYRALFAWLHRPPLVQLLCIPPVAVTTYLLLQGWSFSRRHSHSERT
jgi:putative flippase GtrA